MTKDELKSWLLERGYPEDGKGHVLIYRDGKGILKEESLEHIQFLNRLGDGVIDCMAVLELTDDPEIPVRVKEKGKSIRSMKEYEETYFPNKTAAEKVGFQAFEDVRARGQLHDLEKRIEALEYHKDKTKWCDCNALLVQITNRLNDLEKWRRSE